MIDKIPVWYRTGLGRYLYGTALVPSAEGIYQSDVYFGSVESAVTRLDTVLAPCERERERERGRERERERERERASRLDIVLAPSVSSWRLRPFAQVARVAVAHAQRVRLCHSRIN